jgi:hypothetical protein
MPSNWWAIEIAKECGHFFNKQIIIHCSTDVCNSFLFCVLFVKKLSQERIVSRKWKLYRINSAWSISETVDIADDDDNRIAVSLDRNSIFDRDQSVWLDADVEMSERKVIFTCRPSTVSIDWIRYIREILLMIIPKLGPRTAQMWDVGRRRRCLTKKLE